MCGRRRAPQAHWPTSPSLIDGVVFDRRLAALALAARFVQFPVHVDQPHGARAFMQVVHVLRAEKEAVAAPPRASPSAKCAGFGSALLRAARRAE